VINALIFQTIIFFNRTIKINHSGTLPPTDRRSPVLCYVNFRYVVVLSGASMFDVLVETYEPMKIQLTLSDLKRLSVMTWRNDAMLATSNG